MREDETTLAQLLRVSARPECGVSAATATVRASAMSKGLCDYRGHAHSYSALVKAMEGPPASTLESAQALSPVAPRGSAWAKEGAKRQPENAKT